jgi:putative SOS response-associated peptidase YedK
MRTDRWRSSQHMADMARTAGTKANPVEEPQLLGLLTTQADAEVGAAHPKAMPVILTSVEAVEQWLRFPRRGPSRFKSRCPTVRSS